MGLAAGLSLGASAAQKIMQMRAASAQQSALRSGLSDAQWAQKQAANQVNQTLSTAAANTPEANRAAATAAYANAVRGASTKSAASKAPISSSRYNTDKTAAGQAVADYGTSQADTLGALLSPSISNENIGLAASRSQGIIDNLNARAKTANYIAQLKASTKRANPYLDMGLGLLSKVAGAYAGGNFLPGVTSAPGVSADEVYQSGLKYADPTANLPTAAFNFGA